MSEFLTRVASAPISWGICEVPGWGVLLPTARVLREMSDLGMPATELGAPGFLPGQAAQVATTLSTYGLELIGGFTPLVLHDRSQQATTIAKARRVASLFQAAGATKMVSAVVADWDWAIPHAATSEELAHMVTMLGIVDEICEEYGIEQVVHPHVETMIETDDDIRRVFESCDVKWCLDTGHLAIAGTDPVEFAINAFDRVGHVHLKDVRMSKVPALMSREKSIMESVQDGLFTTLGEGDVDIAGVVQALEQRGYQGWYVIEQDVALTDGLPAEGEGPLVQVRASLDFLRGILLPTNTILHS